MRFDGDLILLGLGGVVGKFISNFLSGINIGGAWGSVIIKFLAGGFLLGFGRGAARRFMQGAGTVVVADSIAEALSLVGVGFGTAAATA